MGQDSGTGTKYPDGDPPHVEDLAPGLLDVADDGVG